MYEVIQTKNADIKKLFFKKTALFVRLGVYKVQRVGIIIVVIRNQKKSKKLFVKSNSYSVVIVKRKDSSRKVAEKEGQEVKKTI